MATSGSAAREASPARPILQDRAPRDQAGPAPVRSTGGHRAALPSPRRRVLYVAHHHPSHQPGGAQGYALELYEAMRASAEFEPIFLARAINDYDDDGHALHPSAHLGTPLRLANRDPHQYLFYAPPEDYDYFFLTSRNKSRLTTFFVQFLLDFRPEVVHFQHTQGLGLDLLRLVGNTLPDAVIVYTLHEFVPICFRHGQMIRTKDNALCDEASPERCRECFPEHSAQDFFLRQRFVQSHLSVVNLFLAPSHFLLERYVQWGIPRERIRYLDNGRLPVAPIADSTEDRVRNRLGFFGQVNPFKGVLVLLNAMKVLGGDQRRGVARMLRDRREDDPGNRLADSARCRSDVHLWLHGANIEIQAEDFQEEFHDLLAATKRNVTFAGEYDPSDLPRLMANIDWVVVPSIWWENAPLVIQEAFLFGRPIICSDIGGMAEKVTHGGNGLHFRVGDPLSLAETICSAVDTPGLWDTLHRGIPQVPRMDDHVAALSDLYRALIGQRLPTG